MARSLFSFATSLLASLMRPGTLRELASGAGIGAGIMIVNTLVTVLSAILLARMLGVDGYGIYGFAIAVSSMLLVGAEFGMPTLAVREIARAHAHADLARIRSFAARGLGIMAIATAVMGLAVFATLRWTNLDLTSAEKSALYLAIPIMGLAALVKYGAAIMMGLRRLAAAQIIGEALMPLSFLAGVGGLFLWAPDRASAQFALGLQIAVTFFALAVCAIALRRLTRFPRGNSAQPVPAMVSAAWPFLLIGSALLINQQIGTIVIGTMLGTAEVGLFRVASQGAVFATLGGVVINKVTAPYFAQLHHDGSKQALRRLFLTARWLGFASCLAALAIFALAGEWLIRISFGPEFASAAPLLVVMTLGYVGNAFFGPVGVLLSMAGLEKYAARALWAVALVTMAGCIAVAPRFGTMGVATVMALTTTAYHMVLRRVVRRHLQI